MRITRDHGAALVSSIYGTYNRDASFFIQIPTSSPLSAFDHKRQVIHHTRAFVTLESSTGLPVTTLGTTKQRPLFHAIIFATLCLWQFSCVATSLTNTTSVIHTVSHRNTEGIMDSRSNHTTLPKRYRNPLWVLKRQRNVSSRSFVHPISNTWRTSVRTPRIHYLPGDNTMESKFITPELVDFICHRLPHSCARAAYVRQNVRHALCPHLPLLYLLPYVLDSHNRSEFFNTYRTGTCDGNLANLMFSRSDSLFEPWLHPSSVCEHSLIQVHQIIKARVQSELLRFDRLLERSFCKQKSDLDYNVTGEFRCEECRTAYIKWLCSSELSLFYPLDDFDSDTRHSGFALSPTPTRSSPVTSSPAFTVQSYSPDVLRDLQSVVGSIDDLSSVPSTWQSEVSSGFRPHMSKSHQPTSRHSSSSQMKFRFVRLSACPSWCTQVETVCPYFNAHDSTYNGGEPAFLCDESHYHHSSQYSNVYRTEGQCDVACCFASSDIITLVSPTDTHSTYPLVYSQSRMKQLQEQDELVSDESCHLLRHRCWRYPSAMFFVNSSSLVTSHEPVGAHVLVTNSVTTPIPFLLPNQTMSPNGSSSSFDTSHACQLFGQSHCTQYWCVLSIVLYLTYSRLLNLRLPLLELFGNSLSSEMSPVGNLDELYPNAYRSTERTRTTATRTNIPAAYQTCVSFLDRHHEECLPNRRCS